MRVLSQRYTSLPMPARTTPDGTPSIKWPSERHLLKGLSCRHCGSLVIVDDIPTATAPMVDVACWTCSRIACELVHDGMRTPMTPEQFRALPIEQPRRGPRVKEDILCPDCKTVPIRPVSARCRECAAKRREELALKWRIVALLETGGAFRIQDLMARFDASADVVKWAIQGARRDGRRIVRKSGLYRMEADR